MLQAWVSWTGRRRGHRLGGGDIGLAIIHKLLVPALLAVTGLKPQVVTGAERARLAQLSERRAGFSGS